MEDIHQGRLLMGEVIPPQEDFSESPVPITALASLSRLLENPSKLGGLLNLTPAQARKVKALIVGGGTAASLNLFAPHIGDELAAIAGAAISSYLARKMLGRG